MELRYDFNNLLATRVGEHGITDAELAALAPRIKTAAGSYSCSCSVHQGPGNMGDR